MAQPAPEATERPNVRRTYGQFCPVARTLDVIGERWTFLIVRELLTGPMRFSDLRTHLDALGGALLTQRLRDLEAAGLVRRTELPPPAARTVYELTERGHALEPVVYELARFGLEYLDVPTVQEPVQPHLVPLGVRALVLVEALPADQLVVHCAFAEGDVTVRVAPPGHGPALGRVATTAGVPAKPDATVTGSLAAVLWIRQGVITRGEAEQQGLLAVAGPARHRAAVAALFGWQ